MATSEDRYGAAIALGANLPSAYGSALDTLLAVRPLLQQRLERMAPEPLQLQWSPLFRTAPVGGPTDQPDYLNAVVLISGLGAADTRAAEALMEALLALEQRCGRRRQERWGARCLDLDLLWWGALHCSTASLQLPHPRLRERAFVLAPLAAIDPTLVPPANTPPPHAKALPVAELLTALMPLRPEPAPLRLAPRAGWPE